MGGPEAASRILDAAHTIFLHAVADPDPIIKAAGTKMATGRSLQHERGLWTDVGSTRSQHQLRVDPDEVRRLAPGMCIAIGNGRGEKLRIAPTPHSEDAPELQQIVDQCERIDDPRPEPDEPLRL